MLHAQCAKECSATKVVFKTTRYGPNRVAADMVGNGGFNFLEILIYQDFWRIFEGFLGLPWAFLGTGLYKVKV